MKSTTRESFIFKEMKANAKLFKGLAFCLIALLFVSCEEQLPPGLNLGGGAVSTDTSYSAPIEIKQDRGVLIEELTGVQCANCPNAASLIKTLINDNPNQVFAAAMHRVNSGFTIPMSSSAFDFRSAKVDEIMSFVGADLGLPAGAANRIPNSSNEYFQAPGGWTAIVDNALAQTTPLNIHLESEYDADANVCTVTTKVAFTENMSDNLILTIYVTENDIVDYQKDGFNTVPNYLFEHVFRDCITNISGSPLNLSDKEAGIVMQKQFDFKPVITGVNAWNLDNCHILAFVSKAEGADKEVLHTAEVHLK